MLEECARAFIMQGLILPAITAAVSGAWNVEQGYQAIVRA